MTDSNKPRLAIDLDDIERQLRRSAEQPAPKKDPLAELARIVGQDDPFRKLLGETDGSASRGGGESAGAGAGSPVIGRSPGPADDESAFHAAPAAYAREPAPRVSPQTYAEPAYEPLGTEEGGHDHELDEYEPAPPPRSRRGLWTALAVLVIAALGVAGFLMTRGSSSRLASGEPPLVKADNAPLKVAPQNPGGVEIPNQNRQIFERGQESQTRVVDRQEQPLDVRQAVRAMPQNPVANAPSNGPAAVISPQAGSARPNALVGALGEPRRVRTVTVRPDGSLDTPTTTASAQPAAVSVAAVAPTVPPTSPSATPSSSPPAPQPPPADAASRPRPVLAGQPATATPPVATAPPASTRVPPIARMELPRLNLGDTSPTSPGPAPISSRPSAQVAAVPPRALEPARPPAEPVRAPAVEASTGGFSVQIGTRPSETEARAAFDQIAARYASVLGGRQALIRRADLNGKTIFRVRVGPASARAEAVELCVRLKAAGGECFVAAN